MTTTTRKCPGCGLFMSYHDHECCGILGRVTPKSHWFCANCDIEVFPDGSWRYGPPNPYQRQYMTKEEYVEYVKECNRIHDANESPSWAEEETAVDTLESRSNALTQNWRKTK
jgi:hypothetical protein